MKKMTIVLMCSCIYSSALSNTYERQTLKPMLASSFKTGFFANIVSNNTLPQKTIANALALYYTFVPGNTVIQEYLATWGIKYDLGYHYCTTRTGMRLQAISYVGGMACGTIARSLLNTTVLPWIARAKFLL